MNKQEQQKQEETQLRRRRAWMFPDSQLNVLVLTRCLNGKQQVHCPASNVGKYKERPWIICVAGDYLLYYIELFVHGRSADAMSSVFLFSEMYVVIQSGITFAFPIDDDVDVRGQSALCIFGEKIN